MIDERRLSGLEPSLDAPLCFEGPPREVGQQNADTDTGPCIDPLTLYVLMFTYVSQLVQ